MQEGQNSYRGRQLCRGRTYKGEGVGGIGEVGEGVEGMGVLFGVSYISSTNNLTLSLSSQLLSLCVITAEDNLIFVWPKS